MKSRWMGAALSLVSAACISSPRAQEGPIATLKLETNVVSVAAVVRDKQGGVVRGLTRDDFVLKQDGKEQAIRYFSENSELPLTLALLVDMSGSQIRFLSDERRASEILFEQMLKRPLDRAMLVKLDTKVVVVEPMTASVQRLEWALDRLEDASDGGSPTGTRLFDAIYATARANLGHEPGRRAMVLLTDGGDNGSTVSMRDAIAEAQRADIVIYSVNYSAVQGFAGFAQRGKFVLDELSKATGGSVFEVSAKTPLRAIYEQIEEDMRLQYQIGYVAPESAPGEYHKIELKTKEKKLTVEARQGFYSPGPESKGPAGAGTPKRQ